MNSTIDARTYSPSGRFGGANFFYSNLGIQESLTTIRYGVEARRGLIIIAGESGVGKTTLLSRLVTEIPGHISCITVSGSALNFAGVLRLLIRNLDAALDLETLSDEGDLVRCCQSLCRARLEHNNLVALAIDDAHLMPDRTLRNLMHNFLGASAEDPEGALLQLILAGNDSLKAKLAQAALIPLRRRRPVVCAVQPLSSQEVGPYIEQALRAADQPPDLFDERAIRRVALLSQGNPRVIGALCERALDVADHGRVNPDMIEAAARARDIGGPGRAMNMSSDSFAVPRRENSHSESRMVSHAEREFADEPVFFASRHEPKRVRWLPVRERLAAWARSLTLVMVIVAAAALIPAKPIVGLLSDWRDKLSEFASRQLIINREANPPDNNAANRQEDHPEPPPPSPLTAIPGPDRPLESAENSTGTRMESRATLRHRADPSTVGPPTKSTASAPPRPGHKESPLTNRDLQIEVAKAIASRAIMGVEVSVVQGTAILDGRVATERQRRAAERAALSVSGVERVRNRIAVSLG